MNRQLVCRGALPLSAAACLLAGGVAFAQPIPYACSASVSTLISRSTGGTCENALNQGEVFTMSYRVTNASIIDDAASPNDGDPVDARIPTGEQLVASLALAACGCESPPVLGVLEWIPVCPTGSSGGLLGPGDECDPSDDQCGTGTCGCESALPGVTCSLDPVEGDVHINFAEDVAFAGAEQKTVATIRVKTVGTVPPPAVCGQFYTRVDSLDDNHELTDVLFVDDEDCAAAPTASAQASADLHAPECNTNADCDDDNACTADLCLEDYTCSYEWICGEDICRSPGYWATHSGYEKKNSVNVGQLVIDTVGPLEVCGQSITETSNMDSPWVEGLGLSSNLEGLCMKSKGVPQRQLYRQLVAAALNCGISGGDCDEITSQYMDVSFDDCSDVCAGIPVVDGPTMKECTHELDCFNNGGLVVMGDCATGMCAETADYCGGDFGECPLYMDEPQECVPLPGNCHSAALCNEDLGVCPKKTPASSSRACREAKGNDCTIDDCN